MVVYERHGIFASLYGKHKTCWVSLSPCPQLVRGTALLHLISNSQKQSSINLWLKRSWNSLTIQLGLHAENMQHGLVHLVSKVSKQGRCIIYLLFMSQVTDGPVQWDHVTGNHIETKLLDAGLYGWLVLCSQHKWLCPFPRSIWYPLRLWLFWLQVAQDAPSEHRVWVDMAMGPEGDVLLLDDILLVCLSAMLVPTIFLSDGVQVNLNTFYMWPGHYRLELVNYSFIFLWYSLPGILWFRGDGENTQINKLTLLQCIYPHIFIECLHGHFLYATNACTFLNVKTV